MTLAAPLAVYVAAALAEIAGCFAFWAWARQGQSGLWLVPGLAALALFAWLLSRIDAGFAGRAYAAYGGIYILCALGWMALVEGGMPTRWDIMGAGLCLLGAVVILVGPR